MDRRRRKSERVRRDTVDASKRLKDEYPNFKDFTAFIQQEASEGCDRVYDFFPVKQRERCQLSHGRHHT